MHPRWSARSSSPGWGWGLLVLFSATLAYSQTLYALFDTNTRPLLAPVGMMGERGHTESLQPLQLATVSHPHFVARSTYDDVYREPGVLRKEQVYRIEHSAYLELPLMLGSGLGLEVTGLSANLWSGPSQGESARLGRSLQRVEAGLGRELRGGRLRMGGSLGVTRLAGAWLYGYSLEVAARPHRSLSVAASAGRRPDGSTAQWAHAGKTYGADVGLLKSWWAAEIVASISPRASLTGWYEHGQTHSPESNYKVSGLGFDPDLDSRSLGTTVRLDRPSGFSFVLGWSLLAVAGDGAVYYDRQQIGRLTRFTWDETNLELAGSYHPRALTRISVGYGTYRLSGTDRGHVEPWPFSDTILDQLATLFYWGSQEARIDRVALAYAQEHGAAEDWSLRLGYLWVAPTLDFAWQQRQFLVFLGDIHRSGLDVEALELLVPEGRKSFVLGAVTLTYAFAQAIPTRVRLREPPPPDRPGKSVESKGGGYHLFELSTRW
ncbi:MAG: hypothetical protein V3U35_05825 [Candidatus Neomarinimicrobiota bacterium]